MCRVLAYRGPPVPLDELLYKPDSSLVRQSYDPQQLQMLNLGGFGLMAWDETSHDPQQPWVYRTTGLPVFDPNLEALAAKARTTCLLAHVRGIPLRADAGYGPHNLHPFHYPGQRWAMAHNGDLVRHRETRHELIRRVRTDLRERIAGTTDSELVYALILSQLENTEDDPLAVVDAITRAVGVLRRVRERHGIEQSSSLNLFLSDGVSLVALRYTLDFGCYATTSPSAVAQTSTSYLSLWYTVGERYGLTEGEWQMAGDPTALDAALVASEPLTRDVTGWIEVPEYTALVVDGREAPLRIGTVDVDLRGEALRARARASAGGRPRSGSPGRRPPPRSVTP